MSKWKYKEVSKGSSRRANGMMLEHRFVAEQMLKRKLLSEEIVHHIDHDVTNNAPSNLMIFKTLGDHARYHGGGIAEKQGDGIFTCKSNKPIRECVQCGGDTLNKRYCSDKCSRLASRKFNVEKPELERLVWEMPTVKVAERYGVSDSAIAKRCRKLGISKPPRGYWAKRHAEMG